MKLVLNDVGIEVSYNNTKLDSLSNKYNISASMVNVYKKFYGLNYISFFDKNLEEIIESMLSDFLKKNNIDRTRITHVIHTHTASGINTYFSNIIRCLCRKNKINNAKFFSISSNNCASPLNTIDIFYSISYLTPESDIYLLISADKIFTEILQQIPNTTICGEGAAICCFSKSGNGLKLISKQLIYCGEYAKAPWLSPEMQNDFEKKYVNNMVSVINKILYDANLVLDDIKIILPHNVNNISWKKIADKLTIPLDKIYLSEIPNIGHCFGADIFINYYSYFKKNRLQKGEKIIMGTVGLGAVFGAAIFEYC